MDGNFYKESYTYNEGRIFLYKRPNSKNFQCRLRIEGIKGYVIIRNTPPTSGGNSANNYGFGNSNISANIENMQNNPLPILMATAVPQQVSNDNYLNKTQWTDALKNGQILNLHIENNPEANYN